jgi:nitrate reductase gamma subunit
VPKLFGFEDTSTSGMMAVVSGVVFGVTVVVAPRYGLIARRLAQKNISQPVAG